MPSGVHWLRKFDSFPPDLYLTGGTLDNFVAECFESGLQAAFAGRAGRTEHAEAWTQTFTPKNDDFHEKMTIFM